MFKTTMVLALACLAAFAVTGCKAEKKAPTAATPKEVTQEHGRWVYTVEKGDTWDSISQKVYGEVGLANTIKKANPGVTTLTAGHELVIPLHPTKTGKAAMPKGCTRTDIY